MGFLESYLQLKIWPDQVLLFEELTNESYVNIRKLLLA
jgi:hypothetical protein